MSSIRTRFGGLLETNKILIALEMAAVTTIPLALALLGLPRSILLPFLMGSVSLWLRQKSWKDLGLRRPANWAAILVAGSAAAAVSALVSAMLVSPSLLRLTGEARPELDKLVPLPGNPFYFALLLIAVWILAAIGEESVYRGYIFSRLVDLFGSGWFGRAIGLLVSSLMFSLAHGLTNRAIALGGFVLGTMEAGLYLIGRRNLWLPIIFHGTWDTIFLVLAFMGLSVR